MLTRAIHLLLLRQLRLSLALCTCFSVVPLVTAQSYNIVDLGANISAGGINSSGQIAGSNGDAFIYSDGNFQDLGTLGGMYSDGTSISGAGFVAGDSRTDSGVVHAFFFDGNTMQDLGTITGATANSHGRGVNDNGQVAGMSELTPDGSFHAFLFTDGAMQDLGTLGGPNSEANGINSLGDVVGYADSPGGTHAFLYSDGNMQDLGTLGGNYSTASAINDAGQVTGTSSLSGTSGEDAFFYDGSSMNDLGTLGGGLSGGTAINSWGQVVGWSLLASGPGDSHAFFFDGSTLFDLNDLIDPNSGWVLTSASGINDSGEIIGTGTLNGEHHAFLLVPNN